MTPTDRTLAEIRERCEKATPGPWETYPFGKAYPAIVAPSGDAELGNWMVAERVRWRNDADFIAHARTDTPYLLDLITEAQAVLDFATKIIPHTNPHDADDYPLVSWFRQDRDCLEPITLRMGDLRRCAALHAKLGGKK